MKYYIRVFSKWGAFLRIFISCQKFFPWLIKTVCEINGKPDPDDFDKPTGGRFVSIEFAEKAISYFIPNKLMKCDMATNTGNPTKSVVVNELIKRVKNKR